LRSSQCRSESARTFDQPKPRCASNDRDKAGWRPGRRETGSFSTTTSVPMSSFVPLWFRMLMEKSRPKTIYITAWATLTMAVAIWCAVAARPAFSLKRHAEAVEGTISRLRPENHQTFEYTYSVGQSTYTGASRGESDRPFATCKVGDPITVFYDARNPSVSTAGSPDLRRTQTVGNGIAACALIPVITLYLLRQRKLLPPCPWPISRWHQA